MKRQLKVALREWGFSIFVIDMVAAVFSVCTRGIGTHYVQLADPARYLWSGRDPYEVSFRSGSGFYFYSPSSGLLFSSIFGFLPDRLGQSLFAVVSAAALYWGLREIIKAVKRELDFDLWTSPYRHLFFLMFGSEFLGGIIAHKLEVFTTGVILWLVAKALRHREHWLSIFGIGLGFGMVTQWKLQPLPVALLLLIVFAVAGTGFSFAAGLGLGFLLMWFVPFLLLGPEMASGVTSHWLESLHRYAESDWLSANIFQHVFRFLYVNFHWQPSLILGQMIAGLVGIFSALFLLRFAIKNESPKAGAESTLLALAMGSAFIVVFSPLSQSNAYILYAPFLLAFVCLARDSLNRIVGLAALALGYFFISIAYSDLVPRRWYHFLYDHAAKPIAVCFLWLVLFWMAAHQMRRAWATQPAT